MLVDDRGHCVISDFGQSEIKSEVYRLSGTPTPHGTLRWQAPELMAGQSELTQQIDVYAFAICCIEVLTKGGLPWPLADDDAVRHFVLSTLHRYCRHTLADIASRGEHATGNSQCQPKVDTDVRRGHAHVLAAGPCSTAVLREGRPGHPAGPSVRWWEPHRLSASPSPRAP